LSADNGTYILQTTGSDGPEFRVVHCQAIDNIYGQFIESTGTWSPDPKMIVEYFGESKVFTNLEEAWDEAFSIEESYDWTEDGACLIPDFSQYHFSDFVEQSKHS
jgi:ribosomal protein S16